MVFPVLIVVRPRGQREIILPFPTALKHGARIPNVSTNPDGATFAHTRINVSWARSMEFDGGRPGEPQVHIDGDAKSAPSPVDLLLVALASCAATDVVTILQKQRTPARTLR